MPNDTSLQSIFDYAKQGSLPGGLIPTVFLTYVDHFPNSHPSGPSSTYSDLVTYANGPMTLSPDKKKLSGEFKRWRNIFYQGNVFGEPPTPADVFSDASGDVTVVITVSDSGVATYQWKLKGKPIGGMPDTPLNAVYDNGLFVDKNSSGLISISFTLTTSSSI